VGIQIGARPDSGFDDPIGMLKDCHRRIEQFLQILYVVVERAPGRAMSEEEASAVQAALQYFRVGGQRHTADEEKSLFPRMRAEQRAAAVVKEIDALEGQHREADDLHQAVDKLYSRWAEGKPLSPANEEWLRTATQRLKLLYDGHIKVEESVVFPRAAETLNKEAIAAIGEEFRARRG
jgi:hemerythrin-like domain-containing protein